ncbi:SRPBCC family protein [Flavimarina sp. Hel_I_48]|uniref:SRPBCC family protein n=1 Tax=Flavimarina sp. Hel_I_48 TaxID=1392488 RepID=UPI0004DF4010|nr:SRPBCC family protein [Flavimarina sp. Hel_I_48]
MKLESPKHVVEKSPETVFNFLTNVENYKQLMPDTATKFEVLGEDRFVFALKGMPEIVLELKESIPYNEVILGAASEKMPFTLNAQIKQLTENSSEVQLLFDGEFNSMVSMMIKSPIQKFINTLVEKMEHI